MTDLLNRILPTVQKPARYTGGEYNEIKKDLNKGRAQLSLRKDVFNDLDYKTIDPLKPYILTISTGKEVLMTYIYFSRL